MTDMTEAPQDVQREPPPQAPAYLRDRIKRAKKAAETWHANIENYRNLYDFQHYDNPAKSGERRINLPDYTNTVDLAVSILNNKEPKFIVVGPEPSYLEETESSDIEKFLAACVHANALRGEEDINGMLLLNFTRDGCGVLRSVWDAELDEMYYRERQKLDPDSQQPTDEIEGYFSDLPIRTTVLDAKDMYVILGGRRRWLAVFHEEMRSVSDMEAEYPNVDFSWAQSGSRASKDETKRPFRDYWEYVTGTEYAPEEMDEFGNPLPGAEGKPVLLTRNSVMYDDRTVIPLRIMDGYEDIPYTFFWYKPVGQKKPEQWGESLLHVLKEVIPHLETRYNRQTRLVDLYHDLPLTTRTAAGRPVKLDPGIGKVAQLSIEEDIGFPTWQGTPPDVEFQINFLQAKGQESSFPSTLYGMGGGANMAGYAISQLVDSGQARLTTPVRQLEIAWSVWAHKQMNLLKNFAPNMKVHVSGVHKEDVFNKTIVGADMSGYRVYTKIDPKFPGQDARAVALGTQTRGDLSDYTRFERYFGIQQPDEEIQRRRIEEARSRPEFQQLAFMYFLKRMAESGKDDVAEEVYAALLQNLQANGIPGQPGRPSSGPNPEQFSGLPSPTGELTSQEQGGPPAGQSEAETLDQMVISPQALGGFG